MFPCLILWEGQGMRKTMIIVQMNVVTIVVRKHVTILTQDISVEIQPSSSTKASVLALCFATSDLLEIFGASLTFGPEFVFKKLSNLLFLK